MRDILFRGMTENKRWIEGSLADQNGYYISTLPRLGKKNRVVYTFDDFEKVLPETVGQYTGLCDRNGTKIFEGDIIRHRGHVGIVKYQSDRFAIEWIESRYFRDDLDYWNERIEVIGNIYENKELLEE